MQKNHASAILSGVPRKGILKYMLSLTNNALVRYVREAQGELKKVAWPTRRDTMLYSGVVVALCLVLALYSGVVDYLLNEGLAALVRLTS